MAVLNDENYHDAQIRDNIRKMRLVLDTLPSWLREYFRAIETNTSARTRLAYAYDIRMFFEFLKENNPSLKNIEIPDFKIDILEKICRTDIEEYLENVTLYEKDGRTVVNGERGKARKLSALRSMYKYFFETEKVSKNTAELVNPPKIHEKEIIRLDADEVAKLLDMVESGEGLTEKELVYHARTKTRDVAILTLLLGTGIRVSECVGINIKDIDFNNSGIKVTRKGGNESVVYFGDEVEAALLDYLEEREKINAEPGSEQALFLSLQNRRITVRAVEKLVKKYSSRLTSLKKITPHKLRSTYGTALYKETGDIYLVADVLGHKDVNTTRKHYAAQFEDSRRHAANVVTLREKTPDGSENKGSKSEKNSNSDEQSDKDQRNSEE